jgi:medium-chain acyl-[acyl-carrier-protein] hydrolase
MSKWVLNNGRNDDATLRLFCCPYAGGATDVFRSWSTRLPANIAVCPVQLPGRGGRLLEPPYRSLLLLVEVLARELSPYLKKPFALFGHSMGAAISFELAHQLRNQYGVEPLHLFVSGFRAPHLPRREVPSFDLPEAEFIDKLHSLGGSAKELLDNPRFVKLLLPAVRADFELIQTYTYSPQPPLTCPITALGGLEDNVVRREELAAWREQTTGTFTLQTLPGDHFFLHTAQDRILAILADEFSRIN